MANATTVEAIDLLLTVGQLIGNATAPDEVLEALASTAVDHLDADGAAVFEILAAGAARLAASRNVPELHDVTYGPEMIGPELGHRLLEVSGHRFQRAHTVLLVSEGDLFGALVTFIERPHSLDPTKTRVMGGLAELAATSLAKAYQNQRLTRAVYDLEVTRDALVRTERIRALGQMAAGISHDLRNLLSPMLMLVELLDMQTEGHPAHARIQQLSRMLLRGAEVVRRLNAFGRSPSETKTEPVDLNELAEEALDTCEALKPRRSSIELRLEKGDPPIVRLQPSELVSALVNLVVNAFDAMGNEGSVVIRTGNADDGGWVQVTDSGPGIPQDVQDRIFEPFFTTKKEIGTGLGLATVDAFVQRNAGAITLDSVPGKGTTFTLRFPPAEPSPAAGPLHVEPLLA